MDLDEVLPVVGEFGKYQKLLLFLVCLPACIPCGFCAFSQLFMADVPDHWCKVPQLMHLSREERKRMAIPTLVRFPTLVSLPTLVRFPTLVRLPTLVRFSTLERLSRVKLD